MSKLIAFVLLAGAIAVLTAIPAAAKQPAGNGRIVFARFDPALDDDFIYTANPEGVSARIVNPDDGSYRDLPNPNPDLFFLPCNGPWSPDGQKIAFGRNQADDQRDLYTVNADGGGLTQVTHTPTASEGFRTGARTRSSRNASRPRGGAEPPRGRPQAPL